ncbi:5-formyltetrahydrofolate cyclo-ligase [Nakamurella sp. UYEF19]|uniref:5-formyltetrahydrofolate cyclo-ligase n=1 Tax=Nakamurella sp. UYEF19 TaxID=1756392 RepID=UPI00339B4B1C
MADQQHDSDRKNALRQRLLAVRRSRSHADRLEAAAANAAHLLDLLVDRHTVCGYLPLHSEPLTTELFDGLTAVGTTVLVPVITANAALDWCRYPTPTEPGAFGIAEPSGPRLGQQAVRSVDAILVPALAVDSAGHRLGRGGGHYDRTLALLDDPGQQPGAPGLLLVAVLFDDEIVDDLPVEAHDRPVGAVLTPRLGFRYFRR